MAETEIGEIIEHQSFEDFLEEKFGETDEANMTLDDDLPDAYDRWSSNLDVQEVMDYAEEWGNKITQ